MLSDDSSDLSSVPSEDESDLQLTKKNGILKFFSKAVPVPSAPKLEDSPPPRKRSPSPPHEYVLADNPDIAFIVMFRSRFTEAFPKSLANFGPQEIERGIVDTVPGEHVENLLCALLGLLLNRKQDVKRGHYNRALEEAVQTHKSQWAKDWEDKNPLSGGATFTSMIPTQRLTLLKTLILWSLSSSDVVKGMINQSYKGNRHEDDLNQPLSVQPWGSDSEKRRYFLIEGLDDTHFRVYRESNYTGIKRTWFSVAGEIDELRALAEKLQKQDGGQKARVLSTKISQAIPRFEATEDKRKRREYRQVRKQQFKRPEPMYGSMYEGRTRGKRMKYTYSDDEDEGYSDSTTRRSTRNTGTHTPAELSGPTVTLSGRQVKARAGGMYGESVLSGTQTPATTGTGGYDGADDADEDEDGDVVDHRSRRAAAQPTNGRGRGGRHIEGYNSVDEMDDEDEASEQDYGDDEEEEEEAVIESDLDDPVSEDDVDMDEDDKQVTNAGRKLVVKLKLKTPTPEKSRTVMLDLDAEKGKDLNNSATSPTLDNAKALVTNGATSTAVTVTSAEKVDQPESVDIKSDVPPSAATVLPAPFSPEPEVQQSKPSHTIPSVSIDV